MMGDNSGKDMVARKEAEGLITFKSVMAHIIPIIIDYPTIAKERAEQLHIGE